MPRHALHIDALAKPWQRAQSGWQGGEGKATLRTNGSRKVQWTLPAVIARKKKCLALRVPAGEGKAADQVIYNAEAPTGPGVREHFVVGRGLRQIQLTDQIVMVVDAQIGNEARARGSFEWMKPGLGWRSRTKMGTRPVIARTEDD
jgi:hypothetical protein